MFTQKCTPKYSLLAVISAIAVILLLTFGFYILFATFDKGVSVTADAAVAMLFVFLLFYLIFKKQTSVYLYRFQYDTLTVVRLFGLGGTRENKLIEIKKQDIISIEENNSGKRFFPFGNKPITVVTSNGRFSLAADSEMKALLTSKNTTDVYVDKHFDSLLAALKDLIAINSVKADALPDMPFGKGCAAALKYVLNLCDSRGMKTKNVENYCGWAEIGEGEKMLAVVCHLDVVPVGDSWATDPFEATVKDGELFGRGALDDKGPAIATIYAVLAVKETVKKLNCRVRIIFGCDEESNWRCMERYALTEEMPDAAFTPDAEYPVIITEKGIAHLAINTSLTEGKYQLYLGGGLRPNMVCDKAHATVIGNTDKFFNVLNAYDVHSAGLSFDCKGDTLTVEAIGVGAHGSTPEKGKNAFFELFKLLDALKLGGSQGEFVKTMLNAFVDKTDGSGVNLLLSDEASGALSLNLGMCFIGKNECFTDMADDSCKVVIDIRYPISYTVTDISARLQGALPDSWDIEFIHSQAPHHVDEGSPLVQALLSVYREYTGRSDKPLAIGGGTYARAFPNKAVAFGVQFSDVPDKAHQANESIRIDDLLISTKMFASAIIKLADKY